MMGLGGSNPLVSLADMMDTHNIYEVYLDRRVAVRGSEIYGDKQVHVTGMNTNRFPSDVKRRASPFGKEKGTVATWYYRPNESIEIVLTIFKQSGYNIFEILDRKDRLGHANKVYILVKRK